MTKLSLEVLTTWQPKVCSIKIIDGVSNIYIFLNNKVIISPFLTGVLVGTNQARTACFQAKYLTPHIQDGPERMFFL